MALGCNRHHEPEYLVHDIWASEILDSGDKFMDIHPETKDPAFHQLRVAHGHHSTKFLGKKHQD